VRKLHLRDALLELPRPTLDKSYSPSSEGHSHAPTRTPGTTPIGGSRLSADRERGSATLEAAILTPALILLIGLVVIAGRVQIAQSAVEHAASVAAREASLARTPGAARVAAAAAAGRDLTGQGITCAPSSVTLDSAGYAAPVGQAATVSAAVTCTVAFDDLVVPGLPGSRNLTAHATSVLDRYRSR
jgi:Flp pilus assembly protein TadG